jgi:hypothetical protein
MLQAPGLIAILFRLEITHCFPFPGSSDETMDDEDFQLTMMRRSLAPCIILPRPVYLIKLYRLYRFVVKGEGHIHILEIPTSTGGKVSADGFGGESVKKG